jgi:hypothetical protein
MAGTHHKLISIFASAGFESQGFLAPRGGRRAGHPVSSAVTTAMRVISGSHHHASDGRSNAHPAFAAGFTDNDILVLFIAHCPDSGHPIYVDHPDLAARKPDLSEFAFFGN